MREAVDIEVTVKCRIGVDDQEPGEVLPDFLSRVSAATSSLSFMRAKRGFRGLTPKRTAISTA